MHSHSLFYPHWCTQHRTTTNLPSDNNNGGKHPEDKGRLSPGRTRNPSPHASHTQKQPRPKHLAMGQRKRHLATTLSPKKPTRRAHTTRPTQQRRLPRRRRGAQRNGGTRKRSPTSGSDSPTVPTPRQHAPNNIRPPGKCPDGQQQQATPRTTNLGPEEHRSLDKKDKQRLHKSRHKHRQREIRIPGISNAGRTASHNQHLLLRRPHGRQLRRNDRLRPPTLRQDEGTTSPHRHKRCQETGTSPIGPSGHARGPIRPRHHRGRQKGTPLGSTARNSAIPPHRKGTRHDPSGNSKGGRQVLPSGRHNPPQRRVSHNKRDSTGYTPKTETTGKRLYAGIQR